MNIESVPVKKPIRREKPDSHVTMARTRSWNPIAFVPAQVSIIISAVYVALFAILLWIHHDVPNAPRSPTPQPGLNLTQAWLDLDVLSDGFHPLGSKRNDYLHSYLLQRIDDILTANSVDYEKVGGLKSAGKKDTETQPKAVTVFADAVSNITFQDDWKKKTGTCYSESSNILVYIRGTDDATDNWWTDVNIKYDGQSGVLVNAHYDSVASGYGATDDGVGVVTVLQLISYFTHKKQWPRRGLVALLNNGEENGLFGAHEYARHPISQLPHMFLNLEGAGAGGRATLFRSTDAEVTRFYAKSPNPFGTALSGDGFKRGLIRSGTDYSTFADGLGMRGLDVAFYEPRQRYHTDQDDSRNTSPDSVWHMLSASLATVRGMTSYKGDEFEGSTERSGRFKLKQGNDGVWFDVLGEAFVVLNLRTLFALSVTLLVAGPVFLLALELIISRNKKWYPFSRKQYFRSSDDDEAVPLNGFRGFFRFPIAFVIATAAVVALAYLLAKVNPHIIYSSQYAVWVMMLSAWIVFAWFVLAGADRIRPTALQRFHVLLWIYALTWALLVLATIGENNLHIASGYFVVIYHAAAGVALLISYFELLALPSKSKYVEQVAESQIFERDSSSIRPTSQSSRLPTASSPERGRGARNVSLDEDDATERTSLLRGADERSNYTFSSRGKKKHADPAMLEDSSAVESSKVYGDEQRWSSSLPNWTWILQFLILAPINIILVGQIALLGTSSLNQTATDGSSVLTVYVLIAALSTLLLTPMTPFIHRLTYKIPSFLLLVFIGCLIYNLLAFPFSRDARMKFYFIQRVDLDSGVNNVTLLGVDNYLSDIISELPSAVGQQLQCGKTSEVLRDGLQSCSWHGLSPNVVSKSGATAFHATRYSNHSKPRDDLGSWLEYNITSSGSTASISMRGRETKQCQIIFHNAVSSIHIADGAQDPRFDAVSESGSTELLMLSRDWDKTFNVTVQWEGSQAKNQTGRVVCMWNDANEHGRIPAFDEALRFAPGWSVPTKGSDGLVEGWRAFRI